MALARRDSSAAGDDELIEQCHSLLDALPEADRKERLAALEALEGPSRRSLEDAAEKQRTAAAALQAAKRRADEAGAALRAAEATHSKVWRSSREFLRHQLQTSAAGPMTVEQELLLLFVQRRPELHYLLDRRATPPEEVALALQQHHEDVVAVVHQVKRRRRALSVWRPASAEVEGTHTKRLEQSQAQALQQKKHARTDAPVHLGKAARRPTGAAAAYSSLASRGRLRAVQ